MSSLKERKKEKTRATILEASVRLFEKNGYQSTTIEHIAREADVGVGTFYNYFPSKADILFAIISTETSDYVQQLEAIIPRAINLKQSIHEFYAIYLSCFHRYGKRVWAEVFGESFQRQLNLSKMIYSIDQIFIERLFELLENFDQKRLIKTQSNLRNVSEVLYLILAHNIICYISEPQMNEAQLFEMIKVHSDVVIDSIMNNYS